MGITDTRISERKDGYKEKRCGNKITEEHDDEHNGRRGTEEKNDGKERGKTEQNDGRGRGNSGGSGTEKYDSQTYGGQSGGRLFEHGENIRTGV